MVATTPKLPPRLIIGIGGESEPADTEPPDVSLLGALVEQLTVKYHDGDLASMLSIDLLKVGAYSLRADSQQLAVEWGLQWDDRRIAGDAVVTLATDGIAAEGQLQTDLLDLRRAERLARLPSTVDGEAGLQGRFIWSAPKLTLSGDLQVPRLAYDIAGRSIALTDVEFPGFLWMCSRHQASWWSSYRVPVHVRRAGRPSSRVSGPTARRSPCPGACVSRCSRTATATSNSTCVPVEGDLTDPDLRVVGALNPIIMKALAGTAALAIQPLGSVLLVGSLLAAKLRKRVCGVVVDAERKKDKQGKYVDRPEDLLAVAQRRADAVKAYMQSVGATDEQLQRCRPVLDPKADATPPVDIEF